MQRLHYDDRGFVADPVRAIVSASRRAPLALSDHGVQVLRHRDVDRLLRDRCLGVLGLDLIELQGVTEGPLHEWWRHTLFASEGPDHTRLRRLVGRAFTPGAVEARADVIGGLAAALADRAGSVLAADGAVELVGTVLDHYPIAVIAALVGVPPADVDRFARWANDLAQVFGMSVADHRDRIESAVVAVSDYVGELLASPADHGSLLAALVAASQDGERLSHGELTAMVINLLVAGTDTTRAQLGWAVRTLVDHPDQWAALADDHGLAGGATEEVLRHSPAVLGAPRLVREPVELHGHVVEVGSVLTLSFLAANRDPAVFDEPDRFDITRPPGPSFSFGHGPHFCLGANLARSEVTAMLARLPASLGPVRPVRPYRWRPLEGVWGPDEMVLEPSAQQAEPKGEAVA